MRIIWILVSLLLLLACEENDRMAYVGKPGVYFENYKNEDTIKYSFNMTSFEKDTLLIDVKLMGVPLTKEQSFCLKIDINGQRGNTLREVTGTGDFSDR